MILGSENRRISGFRHVEKPENRSNSGISSKNRWFWVSENRSKNRWFWGPKIGPKMAYFGIQIWSWQIDALKGPKWVQKGSFLGPKIAKNGLFWNTKIHDFSCLRPMGRKWTKKSCFLRKNAKNVKIAKKRDLHEMRFLILIWNIICQNSTFHDFKCFFHMILFMDSL